MAKLVANEKGIYEWQEEESDEIIEVKESDFKVKKRGIRGSRFIKRPVPRAPRWSQCTK